MLKYIDENQSIRFLIAECDFSLTVMTTLYYSKLFGVEEKVDISPLFETEKGLSSGHNVISTLLKNSYYLLCLCSLPFSSFSLSLSLSIYI